MCVCVCVRVCVCVCACVCVESKELVEGHVLAIERLQLRELWRSY